MLSHAFISNAVVPSGVLSAKACSHRSLQALELRALASLCRQRLKCAWYRSGPLLEHLLAQQGEQVLVAALPVLESDTANQAELQEESDDGGSVQYKEVAPAERVLQVSRNTQVRRY